jgi:uncharacterized protein (DUF1778 family)
MGTSSNYALRLPASLKSAAENVAREDGTTLNQFIVTAVAEKVSALKTAAYFAERAKRADVAEFDRFMSRDGGQPPQPSDELPDLSPGRRRRS